MKYNSVLFFVLILLTSFNGSMKLHESGTKLYNHKGQLRADTLLQINAEQLGKWHTIEDSLIKHIMRNYSKYPPLARQENIQGELTVSFEIDSLGKLKNFKKFTHMGWGIEHEVLRVLELYPHWHLISPNNNIPWTYYLAFDFDILEVKAKAHDVDECLRTEGRIPINGWKSLPKH